MTDLTTAEVADFIHASPIYEEGFCQQTECSDKYEVRPVPGGGGEWRYAIRRTSEFRVWLVAEGRNAVEAVGKTAREALDNAIEKAKAAPKKEGSCC